MKIDHIGKHRVELYASIEELPVERFFTFNRMLMIDSGIGGDFEAVDGHISKAIGLMTAGKIEESRQELVNMRNNVFFIFENLNPRYLAYAAMVKSIDGREQTDLTDEALREMIKTFSRWGATKGFLDQAIEALKKKAEMSWNFIIRKFSRTRPERS